MTSPLRTDLLTRILDAHERSSSYGRPAPWPRDVIIKIDATTFPEAFAPQGRHARGLLLATAAELEAARCVRVLRHTRGHLTGEPKEIRVGPGEIVRAYEVGATLGYEPLWSALAQLEQHVIGLLAQPQPTWMHVFLTTLVAALRDANPSMLGLSRIRIKRERRAVLPALTAAVALAREPEPAWERVISERLFGDSKLLGRIRPFVIAILVRADPRWEGVPPEEASDLLEAYGVRRKPGLIRCAGAASLKMGGKIYALEDFAPAAHLPDSWADAWVDALIAARIQHVTTIENEFPFLSYIDEADGPLGLASRGEIAVYTGGFPTPRLVSSLAALAERSPVTFQHWGDADVGGLRIWWCLRSRLNRPLAILRTTAAWLAAESSAGGRFLTDVERKGLVRLRGQVAHLTGPDIEDAIALIDALLKYRVKIEQERY